LGLLLFAGPAPAAAAEFGIAPEGFAVRMLDAEGNPEDRAGAHPDLLQIDFALDLEGSEARDLAFELPPGLGLDAAAVPGCPRALVEAEEECPASSQVGSFEIVFSGGASTVLPLFELEPLPGQPGAFGTKPSFSLPVTTELRSTDFGIDVEVNDLPREPIAAGHLALWGIPADHQQGTGIPRRALLSAPSSCGPLSFGLRARSWDEGSQWSEATAETPPLSGCESLAFEPRVQVRLSNPVADSPTGLTTDLSMPEEAGPDEPAQAQIRDVSIEMPAGIGLSPGGAAGLSACSDAAVGLGSGAAPRCPPASKIGVAELESPAIEGAIAGTIYLGTEKPGQRFRVFVVAGVAGTVLKFVGALQPAPGSNRLSAVLRNLPPLSISRIGIGFNGGDGALFASPLACGSANAVVGFTPYGGGAPATVSSGVAIAPLPPAIACAAPAFSPQLVTAAASHRAGHGTSFSSTVRRRQGEQLPTRVSVTLPAGLSARLGTVQACSPAAIAATACPDSSRIGSVLAQVGSGPSTAALRGGLYLTGPYRRAPFGVLIELPAAIGPFDLGSISLRGAAELDARSGRLTVSTDRLPTSIEGVEVRFQAIELSMDRPGFIRNPTSCSASGTDALLEAQDGTTARAASPFRAHGCKRLGFRPAFRLTLLGAGQLRRHGHPGLLASVRLRSGDANLRAIRMSLPRILEFGPTGLEEICSRPDAIAGDCPAGSRIGSASARSSLLAKPLKGGVYVAQPSGNGPPDIWTRLVGGGIEMNLRGGAPARGGSTAIELNGLPDLPLSSFSLRLRPGARSAISLTGRPCRDGALRPLIAPASLQAQNSAHRALSIRIGSEASCPSGSG
jgi:hypothetical protein